MLWLIKEEASHQIMSCNVHMNDGSGNFELWITRPNDKNLKVAESADRADVIEIKEAIDFAIETGVSALRI